MKLARFKPGWTLLAVAAPALLLGVAAFMQYHLIEQASAADLRHRREYTERAVRNLTSEFHEELLSPLRVFRPLPAVRPDADLREHLAALAAQWRQTSRRPGLVARVGFAEQTKEGRAVYMSAPAGSFADGAAAFEQFEWPASLAVYRDILEHRLRTPAGEPPLFPNGFAFEVDGESPVLVFPLVLAPRRLRARVGEEPPPPPPPPPPPHAREGGHRHPAPHDSLAMLRGLRETPDGGFGRAHELKGWCFLTLDTKYLHGEFLHELTERHFGRGEQSDYRVEVTAGPRVVYESDTRPGSSPPDAATAADSTVVLFVPHVQPGLPPPHPPHDPGRPAFERTREPAPPFAHGPEGSPVRMSGPIHTEGPGAWRLALSYKAGSLESLVARARRRNLALSFGVLLLLAASTVALGLAARRARRLARQQMEFVAGVSHELRTPLTVIQSTSYNLSKGTVQDPARVRRYGAVIQEEARRLIAEIERMLSFAGVQSGRAVYDFRPLDVGGVVGRALAEFRPAFEEGGWAVEEDLAAGLPPVPADARAIESAVKNLLENGLKYGAGGKWLRVAVQAARNGRGAEVLVRVEDGGPGVAPADLPRIFEPFYRGRAAHDSAAGGAGLGLALVRRHAAAHGGRVTVARSTRGGASFTLHLPLKGGEG